MDGTQVIIHEEQQLKMYKDKIMTSVTTFDFCDILDMSYRKLTNELGILYLHTNRGLFPFKVKEEPRCFIDEFHKMK
jgi:hypothetical protein